MTMRRKRKQRLSPWVAGLILGLALAAPAGADVGRERELRIGGPGSGGDGAPRVHLAAAAYELVPGDRGKITVEAAESIPLSAGILVLEIDPPLFLDSPAVSFREGNVGLSFGLRPLGEGTYQIDFSNPSQPLNQVAGPLLDLSGVLRPDLALGSAVMVRLQASATGASGERVEVTSQDAELGLVGSLAGGVTLHVRDVSYVVPGQPLLVDVSTYNPQPISDGQVCLRFDPAFFTAVGDLKVMGDRSDVSFNARVSEPGVVIVSFSSPSASINRLDGPLFQMGLHVAPGLAPGTVTLIDVDTEATFLFDPAGVPVELDGDSGRFTVPY